MKGRKTDISISGRLVLLLSGLIIMVWTVLYSIDDDIAYMFTLGGKDITRPFIALGVVLVAVLGGLLFRSGLKGRVSFDN